MSKEGIAWVFEKGGACKGKGGIRGREGCGSCKIQCELSRSRTRTVRVVCSLRVVWSVVCGVRGAAMAIWQGSRYNGSSSVYSY